MQRLLTASLIIVCLLGVGQPAWGQAGTLTATLGPPLMPATPAKPLVDVLYINGVRIQGAVTNLAALNPAIETPQAAALRKANAEVNAINASINAAIKAGTLPMGTPLATIAIQPNTITLKDRNGKPIIDPVTMQPFMRPNSQAGLPIITVTGVTLLGDPKGFKPALGQMLQANPTGETGGAKIVFPVPGGGTGVKGAMVLPGGVTGQAVGTDLTGAPSSVSFGLFDEQGQDATCTSVLPPSASSVCPGVFIATVFPTAKETEEQVLRDLETLFNSLFSSEGLTATFDFLTMSLSLDQLLTPFENLFTQNTDPGLELDPILIPVPEPSGLLVLAIGLALLAGIRTYRAFGSV